MAQPLTVKLSDTIYEQLHRTAEISNRSVDTVIEQGLSLVLPPLLNAIPEEYQAEVYPLLGMDSADLYEQVQQTFPRDEWADYERLLAKKAQSTLTDAEAERLDELRRAADLLTLRKAYAAVLLKSRGYHPPTPSQLPQP